MNSIEQVWREIRTRLANRLFPNIETLLTELRKVIDGIPEMYLHPLLNAIG
jgi:transposase